MARLFFEEENYFCHSWLLFPNLKEILNLDSNILSFQKFFKILSVDYELRQVEERIFGSVEERVEDYPEMTSLQKRAKAYFLSGKKLGNGFGMIKRRSLYEK